MRFFFFLTLFFGVRTHAAILEVQLGVPVKFQSGDEIKLKDSKYTVKVGGPYEPVKCAIPGQNCGAGYSPPRPIFDVQCIEDPCPYVMDSETTSGTTGTIVVHSEETCGAKKHQANSCFYQFARAYKSDEGCKNLKTALGRYQCLVVYPNSTRPEFRQLCDELPVEIFALRWNCYYDWAIRYKDSTFCDKYPKEDGSGRDRCLLKMAERLKDKSLCKKISDSKEHSYVELCQQLK